MALELIMKNHDGAVSKDPDTLDFIAREKSAYITKSARSVTAANILAPILCYIVFNDQVKPLHMQIWVAYMFVATMIRTWTTGRLERNGQHINDPSKNLNVITFGVGLIGFGWGLGWLLLVPDLSIENKLFYMYITTGGMFNSMFAYCVHWPTFYSFTVPIMLFAIAAILLPFQIFHWAISVGLATLFIYVVRIARNFSTTFEDSIRLRLRNEHLYRDLVAERDASIAANIAKSNFIAAASHDLRQPMHAVNVYLEALRMENIPSPEKNTVNKIKNSVTTLNEMFESLLNISRLDGLIFKPCNSQFWLNELIQSLEEITRPLAEKKALILRFESLDCEINGDVKAIHQILMNLISNAIDYTDEGEISITFSVTNGYLNFDVQDTGCGITIEDQSKIFNEFYRVDSTRALHDGLGLGLSIVKRLCELIQAEVEVKSTQGLGSCFTVRTSYLCATHTAGLPQRSALGTTTAPRSSLQGKVVAVIEDDPVVCQAYRQTLAGAGASVVVLSEDPATMQAELSEVDRLDLIISDYRLRQTHGDLVIQQLRESFNVDVPAIIITADTSPEHIDYFQKLNIPVLHKPISFRQVLLVVERLLDEAEVL